MKGSSINNKTINIEFVTFKLRSLDLRQLTSIKKIYNFITFVINLLIDLSVYLITGSLEYAVACGMILELIRKFKI